MEKEEKSVIEAISETLAQAIGDEKFTLPLAAWQTKSPASDRINAAYAEEIKAYRKAPPSPCNKATSLKLLKRFARKDFHDFWTAPVAEYLPAVSEGTMKLCETVYPHDEAIRYAKELISTLSPKELAKDFLYGVAHNAPEYRTALACYYYIKNLPEHEFAKKWVGQALNQDGEWVDRYNETCCTVCGYSHTVSTELKMQFWHINMDMECFYFDGRMGRSSLNTAIVYLEEYKKLPRPKHSLTDYEYFKQIIEIIENTPQNMTSGKLRRELKQSGLLTMTVDQIEVLINTLGYLDILHSDDSHGMVFAHTCEKDILYPLSDRGYAEHPVNRWTRKCGIDYNSIATLFDGIYE
ncbi:MAG: hypothetical protein IJX76_07395 [Clostridia bacterium]|nr:hypothetical protein [Clostridia bacterium]